MPTSFKPLLLIFLAVLAMVGLSLYRNHQQQSAVDLIPWQHDLSAAQKKSQQTSTPILLYFTATWCGPCQEMKRTTFSDPTVASAMQAYIPVKIDADQNPGLVRQFAIEGFPAFVLLDPTGKTLDANLGYNSPQEFLTFLHR